MGFFKVLVAILAAVYAFVWWFKKKHGGHVEASKEAATSRYILRAKYKYPPKPFEFYLRVATSVYNFSKKPFLKPGQLTPKIELVCTDATPSLQLLKQFNKVVGLKDTPERISPIWHYASSFPLLAEIVTHPAFPIKPVSPLVHIRQEITQLRAISETQQISKRMVTNAFTITERGTELDVSMEIHSSPEFSNETIIAVGRSVMLIPARKKKGEGKTEAAVEPEEAKEELESYPVSLPENQGRLYAATSGDYNPWHINATLAKVFGFKSALIQGMFSFAKVLAVLDDAVPQYPLKLEIDWKKPCFLPSKVNIKKLRAANGVGFEMWSQDGQHLHLTGSAQHVPGLKLTLKSAN